MIAVEKMSEIRQRLKQLEEKKREENSIRSEFETVKKMVSDLQGQLTGVMASGSRGANNTENAKKRQMANEPYTEGPQRTSGRDPRDLPSSSQHNKQGRMTIGMFDHHTLL